MRKTKVTAGYVRRLWQAESERHATTIDFLERELALGLDDNVATRARAWISMLSRWRDDTDELENTFPPVELP